MMALCPACPSRDESHHCKCVWCDAPALGRKLTHRAVVRKKNGVPVMIAPEVTVPACGKHLGIPMTDDPVVRRAKYANGCKQRKRLQEGLF